MSRVLCEVFGSEVEIGRSRQIARLWAGYGMVHEVSLALPSSSEKTVIVKQVVPKVEQSVSS